MPERIADQQDLDAGFVAERREARVVAGEHGDPLALLVHLPEAGEGVAHRVNRPR